MCDRSSVVEIDGELPARVKGLIVGLLSFAIGVVLGGLTRKIDFQQEAVRHGVAEYNTETGEWQWKK